MSKCQELLAEAIADRDRWKATAESLDDQVKRQNMLLRALSQNDIVRHLMGEIEGLQAQIREQSKIIEWALQYIPTTVFFTPPIVPEELETELQNDPKWNHYQSGFSDMTVVGIVWALRYGRNPNDVRVFQTEAMYPAHVDIAEAELMPRLPALANRAPMPEDSANAGLDVSPEIILKAALMLAEYHYHPEKKGQYNAEFTRVFDEEIWPHVTGVTGQNRDKREAKNRAGKAIKRTFEQMGKHGRNGQ